jgi:hypothetical protein
VPVRLTSGKIVVPQGASDAAEGCKIAEIGSLAIDPGDHLRPHILVKARRNARRMTEPNDIWAKVERSLTIKAEVAAEASKVQSESDDVSSLTVLTSTPRWRRIVRDGLCYVAWTYIVLKLFIFDIDRYVVSKVQPGGVSLAQFRFFLLVSVVAALALATKKYLIILAYLVFFPIVVLLWKIPRAIWRTRSWIVALSAANVVATFFSNLRFNLVTKSALILAAFGIGVTTFRPIVALSATIVALMLALAYYRAVKTAFLPSQFLKFQKKLIDDLVDSTFVIKMTSVDATLKNAEVQQFTPAQLQVFTSNLSNSVLSNRVIYYWAYQLDRYRRSVAAYFFGTLTYLWLFLYSIAAFTLLNLAALKLNAFAYDYERRPSVLQLVHYSLSSLFGTGINGLDPVGSFALSLKIAASICGPILLAALALNYIFTARRIRDDLALKETIAGLKAKGAELESRLSTEYEVSLAEAMVKLQQLGDSTLGLITYFTAQIPRDFENPDG